jgi:hypothetical protein
MKLFRNTYRSLVVFSLYASGKRSRNMEKEPQNSVFFYNTEAYIKTPERFGTQLWV